MVRCILSRKEITSVLLVLVYIYIDIKQEKQEAEPKGKVEQSPIAQLVRALH